MFEGEFIDEIAIQCFEIFIDSLANIDLTPFKTMKYFILCISILYNTYAIE